MRPNDFVIVRTYGGGVHCGFVDRREGQLTVLTDARRIWRWRGARTLNEMANHGLADDWTRISEPVSSIELPTTLEVIACTSKAMDNLMRSRWAP